MLQRTDTLRKDLAKAIAKTLEDRQLTQTQAARLCKDAPSQLSLVVNGRLKGFSTDRLLRIYTALGHDVRVVGTRAKRAGTLKHVLKA